jgi:hypothetical protein
MTMLAPSPEAPPRRTPRHDGLTPERQEEFLEMLAATGSISDAAAAIGISRTALYRYRQKPEAADFSERWAAALRQATMVLTDEAFERAVKGKVQPVWYKGEQIGERVHHNDRMVMFLLRSHDPATYGVAAMRAEEPRPAARPAMRPSRPATPTAMVRTAPALVSTLSTSHADPDEDMNDETFRAELRKLRGSPALPQPLSKRAARRLAAKGRS